jgi:hypothetical protein
VVVGLLVLINLDYLDDDTSDRAPESSAGLYGCRYRLAPKLTRRSDFVL